MREHYDVCKNNWVCKRLGLHNLIIEPLSTKSPDAKASRLDRRMDVTSILNDEVAQDMLK